MLTFLRSEIFRLRRRRMLGVLFLFVVLLPIALYVLLYTSTNAQIDMIRSGRADVLGGEQQVKQLEELVAQLLPRHLPEMAMGLIAPIVAILAVVLAGNTTGNEFGWGTVRTVLTHAPGRASFLLGKLVALAGGTVALTIAGFLAALAGSILIAIMGRADASVTADFVVRFVGNMGKVAYVTLPYVALAVMVAVLARSAAAGVGFGLVVFFGESLVSQIAIQLNRDLRPIFDAGIARNVSTITRANLAIEGAAPTPLPGAGEAGLAYLILGLYMVAFTAVAVYRVSKRDLTLA